MKKIEAIIRQEQLERVKMLLATLGYHGMTIAEVSGVGKQKGFPFKWGTKEYKSGVLPKLKIEFVVMDEDVSQVLGAIVKGAKTKELDDGKIFILPIEDVIRVHSSESGIDAM